MGKATPVFNIREAVDQVIRDRLNDIISYLTPVKPTRDEFDRSFEEAYQRGWDDCRKDAETPRALTIQDLDAIYNAKADHVWPYNTPPELWMTANPKVRRTCGFWICWRDIVCSLEGRSPFYVRENYGKAWMIWTRKPTDKQQEAVQWDE